MLTSVRIQWKRLVRWLAKAELDKLHAEYENYRVMQNALLDLRTRVADNFQTSINTANTQTEELWWETEQLLSPARRAFWRAKLGRNARWG